ncbi:hypothetical protein CDAR_472111 [Caerostris darwini]|uniref:Uncharacterized protein n=1 Tax=Caerostris darwini TaxID=1538125 RepID=A0AAV4VLU5_9ARAC|nr:hypothetical protein CDAR_472111 [Caerostris darwini]
MAKERTGDHHPQDGRLVCCAPPSIVENKNCNIFAQFFSGSLDGATSRALITVTGDRLRILKRVMKIGSLSIRLHLGEFDTGFKLVAANYAVEAGECNNTEHGPTVIASKLVTGSRTQITRGPVCKSAQLCRHFCSAS